jgi:hypothetical protein
MATLQETLASIQANLETLTQEITTLTQHFDDLKQQSEDYERAFVAAGMEWSRLKETIDALVGPGTGNGGNGGNGNPPPPTGSYPATDGQIVWLGDFSTGDFSQWAGVHQGGRWGNSQAEIVTTPLRSGKYSAKLSLFGNGGDGGGERVELTASQEQTGGYPGQDWYYSNSMYFPRDPNEATGFGDWTDVWQWMHMEHDSSPPLQLCIRPGGKVHDYYSAFPDPYFALVNIISGQSQDYPLVPVVYDQWLDFTFHIRWSTENDGWVEGWINGIQKLPKTSMRTLDPRGSGVYMEQALYRAPRNGTHIRYAAGTRRHSSYQPG